MRGREGEEQAVWWSLAALTANLGGYRPNAPKDLFAARECGGEGRRCGHCRRLLKHEERDDGALEFLQNFNTGTFPAIPNQYIILNLNRLFYPRRMR